MRLAQKEHIERVTGLTPVMLPDEERKGRALEAAGRSSQAIITATDIPADTRRASDKTFVVEKGMASIG